MKTLKIFYLAIILIISSCLRTNNKNNPTIIWQLSTIQYTAPQFYLNGIKYESKIYFSYQLIAKNESDDFMKINLGSNIYELINGKYTKLVSEYNYGVSTIKPNDSITIEVYTPIKYTTTYEPTIVNDSIYIKSDKLIYNTQLFCILGTDTIKIKRQEPLNTTARYIYDPPIRKKNK